MLQTTDPQDALAAGTHGGDKPDSGSARAQDANGPLQDFVLFDDQHGWKRVANLKQSLTPVPPLTPVFGSKCPKMRNFAD
jgi:hypothetical protein